MSTIGPFPERRASAVPWAFLAMLVLVAAVEGFVAWHKDDLFLSVQAWTWRQAGHSARKGADQAEILCLGDSLAQVGVVAPIIESRLGLRTWNLAVSGGQASSSYFLLRRAVAAHAKTRPRAIIVDFHPRLLEYGPEYNQGQWPGFLGLAECLDLGWTSGDPRFFASLIAARMLPSLEVRHAIRANLRSALAGEDRRLEHNVPLQIRRNLRENHGGLVMPHQDFAADDVDREARPWTCHPGNAAYLRRFFDLAAAHELPVFLLMPPVSLDQRAAFERHGFRAQQDAFARDLSARYDRLTIVDGRTTCDDNVMFHDTCHVCREGAISLSNTLAESIAPLLASGGGGARQTRLVVLDRVPPEPVKVTVEDLDQSRAIIEARRTAQREVARSKAVAR